MGSLLCIPNDPIGFLTNREESFAVVMLEAICQGGLYSPNCREEVFSETELPVYDILGNSGTEHVEDGFPF
jgi:hypothetical protein